MIIRTVGDAISDRSLVSVGPSVSIFSACEALAAENIGAVPVVDGKELLGVFSERDVVRRAIPARMDLDETMVSAVMTPDPTTVWRETSLVLAMDLMQRGGFRHLPVTDGELCVGMLSMRDIPTQYRILYERYEAALTELDGVTAQT